MWRSLVARTLGVGEAAGSNPVIPIKARFPVWKLRFLLLRWLSYVLKASDLSPANVLLLLHQCHGFGLIREID